MLSSPPQAEVTPVANFLSGVDLEGNPRYQTLTQGMRTEQIEFAKALCVSDGNATRAAGLIWPGTSDTNKRQRGSRMNRDTQVQALYQWLSGLGVDDDRPVTRDEFVRAARAKWRKSQGTGDVKAFNDLSELVMQLDGIDGKAHEHRPYDEIEGALAMADRVLAEA